MCSSDLQQPDRAIPWLGVTGTNGKTTTTQMAESMLRAAGMRAAAVGNIGRPIVEAILDDEPYDVLVVEVSRGCSPMPTRRAGGRRPHTNPYSRRAII